MKINVREENSTWKLDGDTFFCEHEEVEVVDCVQDHMGFDGHYQTEYKINVCCDCGSEVDDCYDDM